jgi:hypothetical protein
MRKIGQIVLTVGMAMLAIGLVLPYIVGTAIPPAGYNFLQLGGLAVALVGFVIRAFGKNAPTASG